MVLRQQARCIIHILNSGGQFVGDLNNPFPQGKLIHKVQKVRKNISIHNVWGYLWIATIMKECKRSWIS